MNSARLKLYTRLSLVAVLSSLWWSTTAVAQPAYIKQAPPTDQLFYRSTTVLRANPIGLMTELRLGYRHRLFDSDSALLKNAFVGAQLTGLVSPTFSRVGAVAEFAPLSVLQLSAQYEWLAAFGVFGTLRSFESANDDAAHTHVIGPIPNEINGVRDNYANTGHQVTFAAMLQAKLPTAMDVPGVVFRNNTRGAWVRQNLQDGHQVYYDLVFDLMAPGEGWFLINDADLLYMFSPKFTAGARYTYSAIFYEDTHVRPGEEIPDNNTHRVGPLLSYNFHDKDGEINKTLFLLVQWWNKHPYRAGGSVHQAIPMVALGFVLTGDFLSGGS